MPPTRRCRFPQSALGLVLMIRLPSKLLRQRSSVKSRPKRKHDERPALAVLEDAAACLGERGMGASTPEDAAAALEAHGVVWAWQLPHLSPEQWAAAGVAIGYQAAIQAVLRGEMAPAAEAAQPTDEVPEQLRQFLLCRNADGSPAKPMSSMNAMGLAMLCTQRGDIRSLCIRQRCRAVRPNDRDPARAVRERGFGRRSRRRERVEYRSAAGGVARRAVHPRDHPAARRHLRRAGSQRSASCCGDRRCPTLTWRSSRRARMLAAGGKLEFGLGSGLP